MSEVVGLYASDEEARRGVNELEERGYDVENVGYAYRHRNDEGEFLTADEYGDREVGYEDRGTDTDGEEVADEAGTGMAGGAVGGAAVGAGASLLTAAGLVLVPGVGPFLAAGTLAGTLAATGVGAAGGAILGGAAGAIFGAVEDDGDEIDETSAHYRREVEQGASLVTVDVPMGQEEDVASILRSTGATQVNTYGNDGWATN